MPKKARSLLILSALFLAAPVHISCSRPGNGSGSVLIISDPAVPQLAFAIDEIRTSLELDGYRLSVSPDPRDVRNADAVIYLGSFEDAWMKYHSRKPIPADSLSGREKYRIIRNRNKFYVIGGDRAGAMYGGLELAEQARIYGLSQVREVSGSPYMPMRGVKFNIPLDVRTPSYSDMSDVAQHNMAGMWSMEFWKEFIDRTAKYRYNFISLWNLHPFPSLVRVPEYPEVALEDVMQSSGPWKENYALQGTGFDDPEIMENMQVLKRLTMEEKIAFWREVMAYGKSRNVDFYIVTWNIFDYGTGGKYGITDDIDNPVTIDYFRRSVRELFLTYPDLAGIGLTTGENMKNATDAMKEDWAFQTYAQGVLDVAALEPDRKITFLHRQHQTGARDIARRFSPLLENKNIRFLFSYKYAKAHVFSSVHQPFCEDFVEDIAGMKTIWTLRNDDNYYFRWGGAGFVRDFIRNIPYDVSEGFYYGSDQWIWGREFLSKDPESPRRLEVDKHWFHWMLWGRLGYDPDLSDQRLIGMIQDRFPGTDAEALFEAWQQASMIYPKTTGFHWGPLDYRWYIEACKSQPGPAETATGFHDVNRFISLPPHPGTNYLSIPEYAEKLENGLPAGRLTPPALASEIHAHSDRALEILEALDPGSDRELQKTLTDIRCMSLLGKYYACKIEGATFLHLARSGKSGDTDEREKAVERLTRAAEFWKAYMETASAEYRNPIWTNRVGYVDWNQIYQWVLEDIRIAFNR